MRFLISLLAVAFLLVGCGQKEATPVASEQPKAEVVVTDTSAAPAAKPEVKKDAHAGGSHASGGSSNDSSFDPTTGFVVLATPVRKIVKDKIEVTEVFWYGCGHCYSFEPLLKAWKKNLPSDVTLVKNPAIWNANMEPHARIYYAAVALGVEEAVSAKTFEALNTKRQRLVDEGEIADLFVSSGVSKEDFTKAYNSFGVKSQAQQANARARAYEVSGTPEIVVEGKYRVSGRLAGSQENMLKTVNYLIEKERAAKK